MKFSAQFGQVKWLQVLGLLVVTGAGVAAQQTAPQSDALKKLLADRTCVGCNLAGIALTPAKLAGVNLTAANLFEANLYFADFEKANLSGASFVNANLSKARFKDATVDGADFSGANLFAATDLNFARTTTTSATTCPDGAAGPCR